MDLEKRVQELEQELLILKNQIQTTLLDIQEQLLTQTYPALRSSAPTQPAAVPMPESTHHPVAPVSSYTPPPVNDSPADTGTIKVRKVSLNDVLPQVQEPPRQPEPEYELDEVDDTDQYRRWVMEQLQETGVKRTRDLIRNYAQEGLIPPEIRDELLQITAQYAAQNQPKPAAPRPQRQPSANSERTRPQRPAQKQPQQPVATAAKPAPQRQPKPQRPPEPVIVEEEEGHHNLVLRLIAGVQNAGAGVKWSKSKHG
ncbi:MAG: hypothetical protein K8I60_07595 [Anaerolineae bacterium]|nr:hypothetical protein [Anaerolineae bacterium]